MLWTLWSKWMFCWLWKGEIGLAANHFTSHDYSYLTPKNLSSVFFISVIPEQFATSTMTIFIRRQAKGHWVFLKNFLLIGVFVCLFSYLPWNATQSLITDLLRKKSGKWFGNLKKPRGRITTWASLLKYVLLQELIYQWSRERSWKNDGKHWIKLQGRSQAFSKGVSSLCQAVLTSFPFT